MQPAGERNGGDGSLRKNGKSARCAENRKDLAVLTIFSILSSFWPISSAKRHAGGRCRAPIPAPRPGRDPWGKETGMTKHAVLICLAAGWVAAASGCGVGHTLLYEPFGPNSLCDMENCGVQAGDAGCDEGCAAPRDRPCGHRPCLARPRRAACEPCDDAACDDGVCDDGACDDAGCGRCGRCGRYGRCGGCGLLGWVFRLLRGATYCESGCGERYWGDWYGDPPDCHDPCDQCGNYVGRGRPAEEYAAGTPDDSARATGQSCRQCAQRSQSARRGQSARLAAASRSPYAPRIISETDRVVKPAQGETVQSETAPRVAQPRATAERR